jgi:hypothetical protein
LLCGELFAASAYVAWAVLIFAPPSLAGPWRPMPYARRAPRVAGGRGLARTTAAAVATTAARRIQASSVPRSVQPRIRVRIGVPAATVRFVARRRSLC